MRKPRAFKTSRNTRSRDLLSERERGQNLVEFALMMPFVILFIGVIIMLGLALHTRSNLQQAVREGARQAAVGATLGEVQSLVAGNSPDALSTMDVSWCLPPGSAGKVGDSIRVYIDEDNDGSEGYEQMIFPANGIFGAIGVPADITATMRPRATTRLEKSRAAGSVPACA